MQVVPIEVVNLNIKTFDNYSAKKISKMLQSFEKQQPEINNYLRSLVDVYKWNDLETSTFLMISTMAYTMMRRFADTEKIPVPTSSELMSKQFENERLLDSSKDIHDMGDELLDIIEGHNQKHILAFIITGLQSAYIDNEMIEEKNLLPAIIHLKSILDCLDAAN